MKTFDITHTKNGFSKLASSCINNNDVVRISTKEGNVIIMSEANYRNLIESLTLSKIPGMYESIVEGVNAPLNECEKIE